MTKTPSSLTVDRYAQRLYEERKQGWEWSWAYADERVREQWRVIARRELRAIGV